MEGKKKKQNYHSNSIYSIKPYKILAQCMGIWCMTCHKMIPKIQLTVICILLVTNAIGLLHELNPECDVIINTLIPVSTALCCLLGMVKVLTIRLNNDKMLQIITSIVEDWSSAENHDNSNILNNAANIARKILIFQLLFAFTSDIPMVLSGLGNTAVLNNETNETSLFKALPFSNPCFYGDKLFYLYTEIYILQIFQIIAVVLGNVGCDCYFFGITMHVVGQVQFLASDIDKFEPLKCELKNQQTLRLLIRRHIHLLQMVDHLEKIFNIVIGFQVMANVYQICMGGLQILISIRHKDETTAINFALFSTIFLVQLSIYSYAGESLSSNINHLQTALYGCRWYEVTPKLSKDFIFIIARCGKPFHITAGKIIFMNLESLKSILKTLGSYFSVMQAMFDK